MSTVLIVGNGFDLNLGLKTSYDEFFESNFFPDDSGNTKLVEMCLDPEGGFEPPLTEVSVFDYLRGYKNLHNWCDIERALGELPGLLKRKEKHGIYISKESFDQLHIAFANYLRSVLDEGYRNLDPGRFAYRLAQALDLDDLVVYNFNYTDSLEHINPRYKGLVNYVHGSLADNSIIFGVEDKLKVPKYYNFLLKSFSPFYRSHKVRQDLKNSYHIIFFGHSLSKADYHYFETFFHNLTDSRIDLSNRKVTIFTKDDNSRRKLLWQIRKMNQNKTDVLFGNCELKIFMTDSDLDAIIDYLNDLAPKNSPYHDFWD